MKYKQENQVHMKEERVMNKENVVQMDTEMGMAWVMEWLRWKAIQNKPREQERNYETKVRKEEKELG